MSNAQPPARGPRRASRWLFAGLALVGVVATAVLASRSAPTQAADPAPPKKAPPPLQVQLHVLTKEPFAATVTGTGELRPREVVDLSAELARKLVAVHVTDGQTVAAGDLLFELDRRDLEAQLTRLRVQARFARSNFGRFDTLATTGSVSQNDRDQSRLRLDEVNAQIGELEVQLERTRVTAPFAGTFGLRPVSVGAWVSPGQPLGRLTDLSTLLVDFRLPERHALDVALGAKVTFEVDAVAGTFEAEVIAVEPAIDKATRSVVVRAKIAGDSRLLPGMFATVTVPLARREAMFVPSIAVIPSPTGSRVFIEKDGKAQQVEVELGVREPARVEVVKGLEPGARVITTNLLRVKNGAPVVALPAEGGT